MLCFGPGQLDAPLLEGISTLTLDQQTPTSWEVRSKQLGVASLWDGPPARPCTCHPGRSLNEVLIMRMGIFNKKYSTGSKKLWHYFWNMRLHWKASSSSKLLQLESGETTKGGAKTRMPQTKALSYCHLDDGGPTPTSTHICITTEALKEFPNKEEQWRKKCFQRWYSLKTKQEHTVCVTGLNPNTTLRTAVYTINCRVSSSAKVKLPHSNSCLHLPLCTFSSP